MSFSSNLPKETPQSLWSELKKINSRLLLTIPFGSKEEDMVGFIAVTGGKDQALPFLTMCVQKPTKEKCVVSTIVFPSADEYVKFSEKLYMDAVTRFENFNDNN